MKKKTSGILHGLPECARNGRPGWVPAAEKKGRQGSPWGGNRRGCLQAGRLGALNGTEVNKRRKSEFQGEEDKIQKRGDRQSDASQPVD